MVRTNYKYVFNVTIDFNKLSHKNKFHHSNCKALSEPGSTCNSCLQN